MNFPNSFTEDNGHTFFKLSGVWYSTAREQNCAKYSEYDAEGDKLQDVIVYESDLAA